MSALILTSDSLIGSPASGNIEYSGQFYGTDTNNSRGQFQRLVQGTVVASTSGTSIDFTSIPSWVKRITVMFQGVSSSGTSVTQVQLGTGSTTYTTSGYVSAWQSGTTGYSQTTGFGIQSYVTATDTKNGSFVLTNITGNTWVSTGLMSNGGATAALGTGSIALAAALTAIRITTVNGTDTFDAGSINIMYEG